MLTELAPVTFHNSVDVLPALIVDGLLLKVPITEGVATGGVGFAAVAGNLKQPGMRISSSSDREIKINPFNLFASKNI